MNFSRQALLGIGMIIGGSVMLYAMVQQIGDSNKTKPASAMVEKQSPAQESPQPLTTDIETEKRILAQKQKERAARVAEQERRAQQFLSEQEAAEAQALAKARAESQQYLASTAPAKDKEAEESKDAETDTAMATKSSTNSNNTATTTENDNSAREQKKAAQAQQEAQRQAVLKEQAAAKKLAESKKAEVKKQAEAEKKQKAAEIAKNEAPKSPTDYQVKKGDGLIKLARQHNMPVEVLAQANNLSPSTSLQLGQNITIPSRQQVDRLAREAAAAEKAREEKRQKEEALAKKSADAKREAQQKLNEARKEVKETDAKGSFGVQVALANDQAKADELAKKFQSAGYQVKTSPTSRGVRVIVGPERGKVAALALKDKINSDPKVNTTSAWVLYWR
ncbi:LysM peptidoglycan-binding domain-containing protein [uncultured Psychrobacter sp.]|uniref:SPOR and LysM peptidoglycan-binding domain-containing protein n=1 Tax=uncultured Psychrobacter sp. TaxID=259303 RepID=UPI002597F83D|nr:LysM peptidoglycan-binding domain-containing protein [uncultured Psychrobacter sp.]